MTQQLLQIGAGKSAYFFTKYILEQAEELDLHLTIADKSVKRFQEFFPSGDRLSYLETNIFEGDTLQKLIGKSQVVISMLPAHLHLAVAKECANQVIPFCTASYLDDDTKAMHAELEKKGVPFIYELGLDPGIDHMSAMQTIHRIQSMGGEIDFFRSYTGGLIADRYDNPWKYKFTWNPMNVVKAGQSVAMYKEQHQYKYLPYHHLFRRVHPIQIEGFGAFEGYANRDSLKYEAIYSLKNIPTIFRGTIRKKGFMQNWDVFVQLGMTDDSFTMVDIKGKTYREYTNAFLPFGDDSEESKFRRYLGREDLSVFQWLGLFDDTVIPLEHVTPAEVLLHILKGKWQMGEEDKDLIVMQHQFKYRLNGKRYSLNSSFALEGKSTIETAMSKTVGLPLAMCVESLLRGELKELKGCHLPVIPVIYEPILKKLKAYGIVFKDEQKEISLENNYA